MKRVILATLLGAITLFAWQFVSWMYLPHHDDKMIKTWPGEAGQIESVLRSFPESGAYHYPGYPKDKQAMEAAFERAKTNPVANLILVRKEGSDLMSPQRFAMGFAANAIACLIASLVLLTARVGSLNVGRRFFIIFLLGVFASAAIHGPNWVWWQFPDHFTLVVIADVVAGWFLAGLVMALVFKRPKADPEAA